MNFAILQTGGFADEDLVKDGWTDISQRIRDRIVADIGQSGAPFGPEEFRRAYEESDDEKMTEIRARVDSIVEDRATGENLKAWYRQLCKRPCFHDEYLQAFNLPNVHLVDTDGRGVDAIDETGVWVSGVHYELDCLIFASGFEVGTDYTRRSGFDVAGRGGAPAVRALGGGMRSNARHPRARLSQHVHRGPESGCQPHLEYHPQPHRGRHHDRPGRRPLPSSWAPTKWR
jgi:cation diffusion facilitator CzcD-associated flavoprotein CzcO